ESSVHTSVNTGNSPECWPTCRVFSSLLRPTVPLETSTTRHPHDRQNARYSSKRSCSTCFSKRVPPKKKSRPYSSRTAILAPISGVATTVPHPNLTTSISGAVLAMWSRKAPVGRPLSMTIVMPVARGLTGRNGRSRAERTNGVIGHLLGRWWTDGGDERGGSGPVWVRGQGVTRL